jgi:BRCA1-associated protein
MTGRMNRYLVLMKFRDGNTARRWRKEWDGKVFNSMEVSFPGSPSDS